MEDLLVKGIGFGTCQLKLQKEKFGGGFPSLGEREVFS